MVSARTNSCLDSDRAGRSFTAMDAKISTEEGTFTAENAESAENIRTIGISAHNKKSNGCFAPSRYNNAAIGGIDSLMRSRTILIFLLAPAMLAGAADLKVTTFAARRVGPVWWWIAGTCFRRAKRRSMSMTRYSGRSLWALLKRRSTTAAGLLRIWP